MKFPDDALPDWSGALCAGCDPDLWFPEQGDQARAARAICFRCPIRQKCLDYALANGEKFGIWGGLTEKQRRAERRLRVVPS